MKKPLIIGYNEKVAKSLTRDEFVKQHADNHKAHGEYWDSVNKKEKVKAG